MLWSSHEDVYLFLFFLLENALLSFCESGSTHSGSTMVMSGWVNKGQNELFREENGKEQMIIDQWFSTARSQIWSDGVEATYTEHKIC